MAPAGRRLALVCLLALLVTICTVDASKAKPGLHIPKHHKATRGAHRRYKLHKSPISNRTGVTLDHAPAAPVGRKLQQTGNVPAAMTACISAADAANFIVGINAAQMTVSNAAWKTGSCNLATYVPGNGLQWGAVTTWTANHALAGMFGNSGACNVISTVQQVVGRRPASCQTYIRAASPLRAAGRHRYPHPARYYSVVPGTDSACCNANAQLPAAACQPPLLVLAVHFCLQVPWS